MTELAPYVPPAQAEIDYTWNLAAKLSKTEFVPVNLRGKPEAVLAVFLTGRELGIGPMQSLRDIYPVNGRPALMASLMVARVRGLGHRFRTVISDDRRAIVQIHRKGEPEPEPQLQFTIDDAKRAELTSKAVWRQYPKAMLWNRAASAACRRDCPEALGGAVYTPEEIEDGNGATTATWGAPEVVDQPSGAGGDTPAGQAGSDRPAPDHTSDPGASIPPDAPGSDQTSPPPLSPGKAGRGGDLTSAAATEPAAADAPPTSKDGEAIPDDTKGEGPAVDLGTGTDAVPAAGPTPRPGDVVRWAQAHNLLPSRVLVHLKREHPDDFGDLRSIVDLGALSGEQAGRAIAYLKAAFEAASEP
jgi:hypothetical protein